MEEKNKMEDKVESGLAQHLLLVLCDDDKPPLQAVDS